MYIRKNPLRTGQRHGVDILPVIRERHVRLAEPDGVFSRRDTIIYFEIFLGNALKSDEKNGRKEEGKMGSLPFEESTFRCREFQHPADGGAPDGGARPEIQRWSGREGRRWKGQFR
jgi:hypothetical protein